MEIKTRFDSGDIVYFLSTDPNCVDDKEHYWKTGEVFIVKGKVGLVHITGNHDKNYEVEYSVYIRALDGVKQINVSEEMLANNREELGNMVADDFYVSGETHVN